MRYNHICLRKGDLIFLKALNNKGETHPGVLAFSRQCKEETGIFAINFREYESNFLLDLSNLLGDNTNLDTICKIKNWDNDDKEEYFFLRELTQGRITRTISV